MLTARILAFPFKLVGAVVGTALIIPIIILIGLFAVPVKVAKTLSNYKEVDTDNMFCSRVSNFKEF